MVSSRASKHVSGTIQVKMGFTMPKNVNHTMNFDEVYDALVRRSRSADLSILSAPPVCVYPALHFISVCVCVCVCVSVSVWGKVGCDTPECPMIVARCSRRAYEALGGIQSPRIRRSSLCFLMVMTFRETLR